MGDQALIHMANILKEVCGTYKAFLARYGGDEFSIILECDTSEMIDALIIDINQHIEQFNRSGKSPYTLSISIGYAEFGTPATDTVDHLLEVADNQMYRQKSMR